MKKYLLISVLTLCVLAVQAHGNGEVVNPKPINYKEVISKVEYPLECKRNGIEGKVIVSVKVGTDGKVMNHRFETYPCTDLREAVKKVLPELRFEPAKNEAGQEVVGRISIPINFKLSIE